MSSTTSGASQSCPVPIRIGVLPVAGDDCQRVLSAVESVGWDVTNLRGTPRSRWPALDLVVQCVRNITSDVLVNVTEAASDPNLLVLVVGRDHDPQHLADVLRTGAADYLLAPFAAEELLARARALIYRSRPAADRRRPGKLTFDPITRTVVSGPLQMSLSPREWDALAILLESSPDLVTVAELSMGLTGSPDNETIVISTISRLRRKIRSSQFFAVSVETVYGRGYIARLRRSGDTVNGLQPVAGNGWL